MAKLIENEHKVSIQSKALRYYCKDTIFKKSHTLVCFVNNIVNIYVFLTVS